MGAGLALCSPLRPLGYPIAIPTFEGTARPMTASGWPKTMPRVARERTISIVMRAIDAETVRRYAVLGVHPGASMKELKRAYRERAKQCHPDLNPTAAAAQEFRWLTEVGAQPLPRPNLSISPSQH